MKNKEDEEDKKFYELMFDGMDEPSLFKKIGWKIQKLGEIRRGIKYFFQRAFRSSHASDCDLWNLYDHLSPILLKKLIEFKKLNINSYPAYFCDYEEDGGMGISTREEYDKLVTEGQYGGGGSDAWEKTIDEMIFAFDFATHYEGITDRARENFLARWDLVDPYAETPENLSYGYHYRSIKDDHSMYSGEPPVKVDSEEYKYIGRSKSYHDFDLGREYHDRAQKGIDLFAKHYWSLWD